MHKQIDFWNRLIGLTKRNQNYPSPFAQAGYTWFKLEREIIYQSEQMTPDFISCKKNNWNVADLTLDPDKDWSFYQKYENLPSSILADISCSFYSKSIGNPSIFSIGSNKSVTEKKCNSYNVSGITIIPHFNFFEENTIKDDDLKKEFKKLIGNDLENPPTSIIAVPELQGKALRNSMKPILILYAKKGKKFDFIEFSEDLLGEDGLRLFSDNAKQKLEHSVRKALINLCEHFREINKDYITHFQSSDKFKIKEIKTTQGMNAFERKLTEWSRKLLQTKLPIK